MPHPILGCCAGRKKGELLGGVGYGASSGGVRVRAGGRAGARAGGRAGACDGRAGACDARADEPPEIRVLHLLGGVPIKYPVWVIFKAKDSW